MIWDITQKPVWDIRVKQLRSVFSLKKSDEAYVQCCDEKCRLPMVLCCVDTDTIHKKFPYARHFPSQSTCSVYNKKENNGERLHDNCVELVCRLLETNNVSLVISRDCCNLKCKKSKEIVITKDNCKIVKEKYLEPPYDKFRADIALIDENDNIKQIIEIYNTHPTSDMVRPSYIDWVELGVTQFIDKQTMDEFNNTNKVSLKCSRKYMCLACTIEKEKKLKKIEELLLAVKECKYKAILEMKKRAFLEMKKSLEEKQKRKQEERDESERRKRREMYKKIIKDEEEEKKKQEERDELEREKRRLILESEKEKKTLLFFETLEQNKDELIKKYKFLQKIIRNKKKLFKNGIKI